MKFRILTNGTEYIVQKKGIFFWSAPVAEGCCVLKMKPFSTYEEAETAIKKVYGTNSLIINPFRYVIAIVRKT
jgi:hypothetical protein